MTEVINRNLEKMVNYIKAGHLDEEGLDQLQTAINRARGGETIQVGDTIILQKIRPRYLVGAECVVAKVNRESYTLEKLVGHRFRTWEGRVGVRVPKFSAVLKS